MERNGFKAFNEDYTNRYGMKFEEGKIYRLPDGVPLTKGNRGTGFHYSPYLEDTVHYVQGLINQIQIARVTALGDVLTFSDEQNYYGFEDISATNAIRIDHFMSREEIMNHMLTRPPFAMERFIGGYKLTEEEIKKINDNFPYNINIDLAIEYYQRGNKKVYQKFHENRWRKK